MVITDDNFFREMEHHFEELCVCRDQPLVMHSSFFDFYRVTDPAKKLWSFLNSYMSTNIGICFPTYCLSPDISYNPTTSRSSVGLFSQFTLDKLDGGIRTLCPIHNHNFFYDQTIRPLEHDFSKSFGINSDFDFLHKNDYQLLLLGVDFDQACTYIHHMEFLAGVPYRKQISFKRNIYNSFEDKWTEVDFSYYARISESITTDFNKVIENLGDLPSYNSSSIDICDSFRISVKDLHERVLNLLISDPTFFSNESK